MSKKWTSVVYAFHEPVPEIIYEKGKHTHQFKCAARGCKYKACQFLDSKDKASTSNLIKHVKSCWGEDAWKVATNCQNAGDARKNMTMPLNTTGSITASFQIKGKGKVSYSHRQHTQMETKYIVNLRLFRL